MALLRRLSSPAHGIPPRLICQLYRSVAVPNMLYAASVWLKPVFSAGSLSLIKGSQCLVKKITQVQCSAALTIMGEVVGTKIRRTGEADGPWNHADGLTVSMDLQSVETNRKQLKTRAEMSVNVRGGSGRKTHLVGLRTKHQRVLNDGNMSAKMGMTDTHWKMCRSNLRTHEPKDRLWTRGVEKI